MQMKKSLLTMLALLSIGSSAFAQTVNVPTVARKAGQVKEVSVVANRQGKVKIELLNSAQYRDLQFDLTLPAGITVTESGVVQDAAAQHTVAFNAVADNKVRFVIYNDGGEDKTVEKFADGIIVEIPVNVAADFTGEKAATLDNILTSDDAATSSISIPEANFNFRACLLGDVDDNGEVDLTDASILVYKYFGTTPSVFVDEVAYVNNDDVIDLTDASSVVYLYFGNSSSAKEAYVEEDINELDPINELHPNNELDPE